MIDVLWTYRFTGPITSNLGFSDTFPKTPIGHCLSGSLPKISDQPEIPKGGWGSEQLAERRGSGGDASREWRQCMGEKG